MRAVTRRSDRKPGSTRSSPAKLRISRPAPIASITATATSPTTNKTAARRTSTGAPFLDFEGRLHVGSPRSKRGHRPEPQTRDHAPDEREAKHPAIDADLLHARDVGRHPAHQQRHTPECQCQSGRSSHQGEHGAFGEELPDDAAAAGAERAAYRHLALPGARAGEQKVPPRSHAMRSTNPTAPSMTSSRVRTSPTSRSCSRTTSRSAPTRQEASRASWLGAAPALATAVPPGLAPVSHLARAGRRRGHVARRPECGGIPAIECVGNPQFGAGQREGERRRHDPDDAPRLGIDQGVAPDDAPDPRRSAGATARDRAARPQRFRRPAPRLRETRGQGRRRSPSVENPLAERSTPVTRSASPPSDRLKPTSRGTTRSRGSTARALSEQGTRRPACGRPRRACRADGRAAAAAAPR